MLKKTGVLLLAMILVAGAVISGCSYSKVLRNRLPTPHRVDDFENAVKFVYQAPQARNVNLCGNWDENGWCGTQTTGRFDHTIAPMQDDDKDGIWEIIIAMKPGRYQYKFSVDWGTGGWEHDQNNPLSEDDTFGGQNSIIILH
jgi:1,4-alpha-glucan branching enzyme